jgi:hypothetical protein
VNDRRFCLITEQDGDAYVSTIAMSETEAHELLAMDTLLHRAAGWRVTRSPAVVHARRGDVVRHVRACPIEERNLALNQPSATS